MKFTKRLVLSSREYEELIASLDSSMREGEQTSIRTHDRRPFRTTSIPLCVNQPDGGQSHFIVYGRNISRGGVSVLHGGFLHPGSACRLILQTRGDDLLAVAGIVRHCRLVNHFSHEVGIQFLEEINPRNFLVPDGDDDVTTTCAAEAGTAGTVLVVDGFEPDRRMMEHQLRTRSYRVTAVETSGAALDAIKSEEIDLVLSGLDLTAENGLYLVQSMRQLQFRRPIIIAMSDSSAENLALVSQVGADDVLIKPVSLDVLAAQLDSHLGTGDPRGSLVSRVQTQPGMRDLVAQYVEHLRLVTRRLRRAYVNDDLPAVRDACCRIKGSALNFGFPALTVAAQRAVAAIDRQGDEHDARVAVRHLLDCCDRVQYPSLSGPAIQLLTSKPAPTSSSRPAA